MQKYIARLKWYLHRLRMMGLPEVLYRIRQQIRKLRWRIMLPLLRRPVNLRSKLVSCPHGSANGSGPQFWIDLSQRGEILRVARPFVGATVAKAEKLLAHRFTFFGLEDEYFGEQIHWNRDYTTGTVVPMTYSGWIDVRDEKVFGNNKGTWEHNRHNHLVTLARAFYLTGDEKHACEAVAQIEDWIRTNPYLIGPNWTSALECGIRIISWSWVLHLLKGSVHCTDSFRETVLANVWRHCNFIRHNPSLYSSANNHRIGELSGLFVGSTLFPELRDSSGWQRVAYKALVEEIGKQVCADGVCKEQAVSYHCFDIDFFLLCGLLGERNGMPFPKEYWDRLERMIEFIAAIMGSGRHVPQIGDSDDGRAIILSETDDNYYASFLGVGACLFDRSDFKAKAGAFPEKALWLAGPEAYEKYNRLRSSDGRKLPDSFREGGYYVLGCGTTPSDEIKIVFDCGELGYTRIAAHGHADCLSFTLSAFGNEILVDPGTYAYHTMAPWRRYFKGTIAHNTVRIDKTDQSVYAGYFMWTEKARRNLIRWESTGQTDTVVGSHDGYRRLPDPVTHTRELQFTKGSRTLTVRDSMSAQGVHEIELAFHFAPGCRVTVSERNKLEVDHGDAHVVIHFDERFSVAMFHGSTDPIVGWVSYRLDVKVPACSVIATTRTTGDAVFMTEICIETRD